MQVPQSGTVISSLDKIGIESLFPVASITHPRLYLGKEVKGWVASTHEPSQTSLSFSADQYVPTSLGRPEPGQSNREL